MFSVYVIIPVYCRENVFRTLDEVRRFAASDVDLHFLVIDNGNESPLREKLLTLAAPDSEIIRLEKNLGGAGAYRAGMEKAVAEKADFLWLLDDDAEPDEKTLPELLAAYREWTAKGVKVGAVAGAIVDAGDGTTVVECGASVRGLYGKLTPCKSGEKIGELPRETFESEYVAATSMLISGAAAKEVGAFAPVFIHYDDIEWCFRARRKGYRIFAATKAVVRHPSWPNNFSDFLYYFNTRNKLWFLHSYRRRQYLASAFLLRMKALLLACTGKKVAADLMRLGIRHAAKNDILSRREIEDFIAQNGEKQ